MVQKLIFPSGDRRYESKLSSTMSAHPVDTFELTMPDPEDDENSCAAECCCCLTVTWKFCLVLFIISAVVGGISAGVTKWKPTAHYEIQPSTHLRNDDKWSTYNIALCKEWRNIVQKDSGCEERERKPVVGIVCKCFTREGDMWGDTCEEVRRVLKDLLECHKPSQECRCISRVADTHLGPDWKKN